MKKALWIILVLVLVCVLALSACDKDETLTNDEGNLQTTVKTDENKNDSEDNTIPSTNPTVCQHAFGDWNILKQATCKEEGKRARICSICAETEEESIQISETHNPVTDAAVPATCTNTGLTEGSHCSLCNKVLVAQTTVPTANHSLVTDAAVPATCKNTGLTEGSHCSLCNKVFIVQVVTPKTDHNYVDNLCKCGAYKDSEGLAFTKSGNIYVLSGIGECQDARIVVPAMYNGLPVTKIATDAFKSQCGFYEIILPSSITAIGARAFENCQGLKTIKIPSNVKYLERETFSNCTSLESVVLSNNILQIMENCFAYCTSLQRINLPSGLLKIREYAFGNCSKLEEIDLPSSLNEIQQFAFLDCTSLRFRYLGMKWQFKEISKGFDWSWNTASGLVVCYDGEFDIYYD